MAPPEDIDLVFGERGAERRHGGDTRPLAGQHVHITFDHHQFAVVFLGAQKLQREP